MSVPFCPVHGSKMRGHRERVPFVKFDAIIPSQRSSATRMAYRCRVEGCPRVEAGKAEFGKTVYERRMKNELHYQEEP
jgi:hypothetical protein